MRVGPGERQAEPLDVSDGKRRSGRCCAADQGVVDPDACPAKRIEELHARSECRPDVKRLLFFGELEDRATFGSRQLNRVHDDLREDIVEVERRVHGLAHRAQPLELLDGLGELLRSELELLHQIRVPNRHRSLGGEGRGDFDLTRSERVYLPPPDRDDADHLVIAQHRNRDDAAEAAEALRLGPFVGRVGEDVGDQHRPAVEPDRPTSVPCPVRWQPQRATIGIRPTRRRQSRGDSDPRRGRRSGQRQPGKAAPHARRPSRRSAGARSRVTDCRDHLIGRRLLLEQRRMRV